MQSTSARTLVDTQDGLRFAKSPRWIRRKLLFLDIHCRCIKFADLDGTVQTVRALPYLPGAFEALADGGLIVGDALRRKIYRWEAAGPKQMADLSNVAKFCISDGIVDSRGGMYIADVGFDFLDPLMDPMPNGIIVHISADGKSSVVAGDLLLFNIDVRDKRAGPGGSSTISSRYNFGSFAEPGYVPLRAVPQIATNALWLVSIKTITYN